MLSRSGEGRCEPDASPWWVLGWALPLVLQVVHAVVVAPTYHVGSFDDDGNYLMAAHVLASGGGLTSLMPSGVAVVGYYLPGYPLLLVPLIWVFGNALWAPRLLSVACVAALYPLLWAWMGRRDMRPSHRTVVLGLLALNSVVATYATMVMAEAPFLVVLVLLLFVLDRWEGRVPATTLLAVVLLGELVWLKQAAVGLVAGLVFYELWRRRWRSAAGIAVGTGLLVLPGLLARWATGGATVGERYAGEISNSAEGGFLHQLPSELVNGTWSYVQAVFRQSVLPSGSPLPSTGPVHVLVAVVGFSVPVLCLVGAVTWYRRHALPELWMVAAYLVETLAYPFVNERRLLLVLPLLNVWYIVGACAMWRALVKVARTWGATPKERDTGIRLGGGGLGAGGRAAAWAQWSSPAAGRASIAVAAVSVLLAGAPTAAGFTRDYLYRAGQQGSEFARSPAMALLRSLRPEHAVVETDYRGSVAYFTEHRTAWTAFVETTPYGPFAAKHGHSCRLPVVASALRADGARWLVLGDFNIPGVLDSPCLMSMASSPGRGRALGAARLLSTAHDDTTVFELLGAGPGLADHTLGAPRTSARRVALPSVGQGDAGGVGWSARVVHGRASWRWGWRNPVALRQLSVGMVAGAVSSTTLAVELPGGRWRQVASASGPVGDGGAAPYLLASLSQTRVVGVRVSARASGREAVAAYVNAIGPRTGA